MATGTINGQIITRIVIKVESMINLNTWFLKEAYNFRVCCE